MLTARDDVAGLLAGRRRAHGAELEALRGRPAHPVVAADYHVPRPVWQQAHPARYYVGLWRC